jgi:hypothetical protein
MTAGKSIFVDLEIDASLMMNDPDKFASEVIRVGDELTSIFSGKMSVKDAESDATKAAKRNLVAKEVAYKNVEEVADKYDKMSEDMDLDELYYTIKEFKSIVETLELAFNSRSRNAMIMSSSSITDKKLAHSQYMKLREAYGAFIQFSQLMNDKIYVNLKPRTGNYQSDVVTYPAYRFNGEIYQNYRAVARLAGWNSEDFHNHMDLVEKIRLEGMEETIEIIEVTL